MENKLNLKRTDLIAKYFTLLVLVLIVFSLPERYLFNNSKSLCVFKTLTGIQCPMCGMTRAVHLITHFKIVRAIQYNIVVLFFPLILVIEIASDMTQNKTIIHIRKIVFVLFVAGLVILYIYRIASFFGWI